MKEKLLVNILLLLEIKSQADTIESQQFMSL